MPALPQSNVGRTALRVPVMGLGTAPLGLWFADLTQAQAVETVHHALASGITFFDTAPLYDSYLVERRLGVALAGVPRDSYVLATKVGFVIDPDDLTNPIMDFSREAIERSIEGSLERLKIDRIDILHLHDPHQEHYPQILDEAFPLLANLRRQGIISAVGAGMNTWEILLDFIRDLTFDCFLLAGRYTLLEQGALDALNQIHAAGVSVFAAGVYNTGILAKGSVEGAWYQYQSAPPEIMDRVRRIESICARHHVPLNAAALQFVKAHPAVTSLVIGMESPEQIDTNLRALNTPIPRAFWDDLRAAGLIDAAAPVPVENAP